MGDAKQSDIPPAVIEDEENETGPVVVDGFVVAQSATLPEPSGEGWLDELIGF